MFLNYLLGTFMLKKVISLLFTFIFSINLFAQSQDMNTELSDIKLQIQEIKLLDARDEREKKLDKLEKKIDDLDSKFNQNNIDKKEIEITIYQIFTLIMSFIALYISWKAFNLNNKKDKLVLKATVYSEHNSNSVIHLNNKEFIKEKSTGYFAIELVNQSYFEVNINYISFLSNDYPNEQLICNNGFFDRNKKEQIFPINLSSKNSITVYFETLDILSTNIKAVKIKLATGETIEATSFALKNFNRSNSKLKI
jgi:hypothetical protein